jgi:DNA-binding GntR family transcriptional regulator
MEALDFTCTGVYTNKTPTDAYRGVYFASAANLAHMNQEHRTMIQALKARDVSKSIALQAAHRENSVSVVSQVIKKP